MLKGVTGLIDGFKYINGKLVGGVGPAKGKTQGPELDGIIDKQVSDYVDTAKGYESDAYWYKESGDEINRRYSPNGSERMSHNIGISSAQNPLSNNTKMAVENENARQLGRNIGAGKFKDQLEKTKLINQNKFYTIDANGNKVPVAQGNKIGPFTDTLVRNTRNSTEKYQGVRNDGTNIAQDDVSRTVHDIWDIRALGDRKDALTATEHTYADLVTDKAVALANKRELGGRTDWTREQLQASVWEGQRAKEKAKRAGTNYADVLNDEYTGTIPVETQAGLKASVGERFFGKLDDAQQKELLEAYKNAPNTMDGSFFKQKDQVGSWRNGKGEIENNLLGVRNFTGTSGRNTKELMEIQTAIDTHILNQDAIGAQYYNPVRAKTLNRKNGDIVRVENVGDISKDKMRQLTELDTRLSQEYGVDSVFTVNPADKKSVRNIMFLHGDSKLYRKNPEIAREINKILGGSEDLTFVPTQIGGKNPENLINATYMEQGEDSARYFYDEDVNPMLKNDEYVKTLKERVKYLTKIRDDLHKSNGQKINPFKAQAERLFVRGGPKAVKKGIDKWKKSAGKLDSTQVAELGNKKWSALLAMGAIPPAMAGEVTDSALNARDEARARLKESGINLPSSDPTERANALKEFGSDSADFAQGLIAGAPEGFTGSAGEAEGLARAVSGLLSGGFEDWDKDLTFRDRLAMAGKAGMEGFDNTILPTITDMEGKFSNLYSDDFNKTIESDGGDWGRTGGQLAGELASGGLLYKLMKKGVKLTAKQLAQLERAKEMQLLGQ